MESFASNHETLNYQDSSPTKAENVQGLLDMLSLSQASKLTHDHSQNYEQSWAERLMLSESKKNFNLKSSEHKTFTQNSEDSQTYSLSKPEDSLSADNIRSEYKDDLLSKGSKNANDGAYNLKGICGDTLDSDKSSRSEAALVNMKPSKTSDDRIHKVPVTRQDSIAYDIELDDAAKAHKMMNQSKAADKRERTENVHSSGPQKQNAQNKLGQVEQNQIVHPNNKYVLGVHHQQAQKQKVPSGQILAPSFTNGHVCEKNRFLPSWLATPRSDSSEPSFRQSSGRTYCLLNSEVDSRIQPAKKSVKSSCFDDSVNFEKNVVQEYKNQCRDIDDIDKERGQTWRLTSVIRQETVMNIMCIALIVLAVGVVQLHMRLSAIERVETSSSESRCQCPQDRQMVNKNHIQEDRGIKSVKEDVYSQITQYLDDQESPTDRKDVSYFLRGDNDNEDKQALREDPFDKEDQGENVHTENKHSPKNLEKLKTDEITASFRSSNSNNLRIGSLSLNVAASPKNINKLTSGDNTAGFGVRGGNTTAKPANVQIFELPDLSLDAAGGVLSRKVRSARIEEDPQFAANRRKESGKSKTNKASEKKKDSNGSSGSKSQAESFEVRLHEIVNHKTDFKDKDCTAIHKWGNGIEACRDHTFKLPVQHSVLPFYVATVETANKKKRMVLLDDKKPGKFHIQVPGDYLVQLNITVVHDTEIHYLALYLNGQAMFACNDGGFRCPHTNHNSSNKYRKCNIIGLLELKKDDVLDIRTMEPDMTVRAEKLHMSYFRVILLNKRK